MFANRCLCGVSCRSLRPVTGRIRRTGRPGPFCEVSGWSPGPGRPAIARRLSVAPRTAGADAENIRRELQVPSHAQIAARVSGHRLVPERLGSLPDGLTGCDRPSQGKG